jgi:hypothetical protein
MRHASEARRAPVVTHYDLGLLNVESRFEVPRIVEALRARPRHAVLPRPPGTGKTALAEHIASRAAAAADDPPGQRPGQQVRRRDRTEHGAHVRARPPEQAVLLLDEADSFLRSRRRAERNYEVTEVNEMLQGMERFAGIFICTTNLFDDLDEAALRRFTFKIRFHPCGEQRERMFVAEALAAMACGADGRTAPAPGAARSAGAGRLRRRATAGGHPGPEASSPTSSWPSWRGEHRVKPQVRERRGPVEPLDAGCTGADDTVVVAHQEVGNAQGASHHGRLPCNVAVQGWAGSAAHVDQGAVQAAPQVFQWSAMLFQADNGSFIRSVFSQAAGGNIDGKPWAH